MGYRASAHIAHYQWAQKWKPCKKQGRGREQPPDVESSMEDYPEITDGDSYSTTTPREESERPPSSSEKKKWSTPLISWSTSLGNFVKHLTWSDWCCDLGIQRGFRRSFKVPRHLFHSIPFHSMLWNGQIHRSLMSLRHSSLIGSTSWFGLGVSQSRVIECIGFCVVFWKALTLDFKVTRNSSLHICTSEDNCSQLNWFHLAWWMRNYCWNKSHVNDNFNRRKGGKGMDYYHISNHNSLSLLSLVTMI